MCPYTEACQCEHIDHFNEGNEPAKEHPYRAVLAGDREVRAVGRICNPCATGHMARYVIEEKTS